MANLITCSKILLDYNHLKTRKELVELKKTIATHEFLDHLQYYLNYINFDIVKCGCANCTSEQGMNYPDGELVREVNESGERIFWNDFDAKKQVELKDVDVHSCLLYTWFKEKCEEFKVPTPDDAIDHPVLYSRWCDLETCLGRALFCFGHNVEDVQRRWRARIKVLTYNEQVNTIYKLIYHMEKLMHPDSDESFEEWFCVKDKSLLF